MPSALSPQTRDQLKRLYNALADRVLEPNDPVYVPEVNGSGPSNAVDEIANEVDWQEGGGVCLFTGQRGTGKSTELKRLKRLLEEKGAVVFYVDLSEFILLTKEIEITDFLISVAGAMSEAVQTRFGGSPAGRGYWERFWHFLHSEVVLEDVTVKADLAKVTAVEVKASLKNDPTFKQRVQEASRGYVAKLVQQAHTFLGDAVDYVRQTTGNSDQKVVLLLDSVERIRGVGSEADKVFQSVRNLFFAHANHLFIPKLHVVYTVPPYLSVLAAGAGSLMGGAVTRRLVSTHIFNGRTRERDPEGFKTLSKVIDLRFPEWRTVLSGDAMDRLAEASGGDLREFFRLIRYCLPSVQGDSQLPLSGAAVQPAVESVRREMLPIPANLLRWLKRITETHETCLGDEKDLGMLAHFLDNRLVLNYRNGDDWYDIHPLLRDAVDHFTPDHAAAP